MIPLSGNSFIRSFDQKTERVPVWFMRQAGRYLPAYKEIRSRMSIKQICSSSETMVNLSYAPVRDLGVDAAIIFYDITLPLEAMGHVIDFKDDIGPVVSRNRDYSETVPYNRTEDRYVLYDAIQLFKKTYPEVPLIGFSGGPMTLASYISAGRSDRELSSTRRALYKDTDALKTLLSTINDSILEIIKRQVEAGVDVVQVFDSWSSSLSSVEFEEYAREYLVPLFEDFPQKTRSIYFTVGSGKVLSCLRKVPVDFVSVDSHTPIKAASEELGNSKGIQGNLDSFTVANSREEALRQTKIILHESMEIEKFIFNLGHGVLPATDPSTLVDVVRAVRSYER